MKSLLFGLFFLAFSPNILAENTGSIIGKIKDGKMELYPLILKKGIDSTIVKTELTTENNSFLFEQIPYGTYFIEAVFMSQVVGKTPLFTLDKDQIIIDNIVIEKKEASLNEVTITVTKEVVERKLDKIIYNVENTLEAPTSDALSVMQKAPGITVDQNGGISMRGKHGVMVMINGKMTNLNGNQLSNLLRTTTANQISKIEMISNPSSKYDAEGNSGIVNIVLKKDQRYGTNGIVVLSYGSGKYHKSANGININFKKKNFNLFSSCNYANNADFNDLQLNRKFYSNSVFEGAYRQKNYLAFPSNSTIFKLGLDYNLSPSLMISAIGNLALTKFNPNGNNKSMVENNQGIDQSYYTSNHNSKEHWNNHSVNLNAKKILDSLGQEISTDIDYANYDNSANQLFNTRYYNLNNQEYQNPYLLTGDVLGNLKIKSFKTDYVKPFNSGLKIEAGAKSSLVKTDNNLSYNNISSGINVYDSSQSNHFIYSENINAVYTSISKEIKNISLQVGIRGEQTIAKGKQLLNNNSFIRNYWQLFPTFFFTQKINDINDIGFSFSRRIQRPGYDLMNPIRLFIDATTYKVGNPYLVPQNSYLVETSHTFKQKYLTTFSASLINKSITEVLIPEENQSNIAIQTNKNINQQFLYSLNFFIPTKIRNWWSINNEATVYYSKYKGELANMNINSSILSFNCKTINIINLAKSFALQVDAFFQYSENYSFSTIKPYGALNVSAQKSFYNKKANLKLSLNDALYTSRFKGSSIYSNYYESYYVQRDSRSIILSFSYRYGKSTVPGAKKRTTGTEEEKQRAGKSA